MSRVSPPEIDESLSGDGGDGAREVSSSRGGGLRSIRERFSFKRSPRPVLPTSVPSGDGSSQKSPTLDRPYLRYRSHPHEDASAFSSRVGSVGGGHHHSWHQRRGLVRFLPIRGSRLLSLIVFFAVFTFAMAIIILQSSIGGGLFSSGGWDHPVNKQLLSRSWLKPGTSLRFVSLWKTRRVDNLSEIYELRRPEISGRVGLRQPKLALILGYMDKDPRSFMLLAVVKGLRNIGYAVEIFSLDSSAEKLFWKVLGGQVLGLHDHIDWTSFDGILAYSLDNLNFVVSLMQDPFRSLPLIWIIEEDILADRLTFYEQSNWTTLVKHWKSVFERANVVVFPDFTLPMLYSAVDSGNFLVIPATPVEVWAARRYSMTHSKVELRVQEGFKENDILVLVTGSSLYYDELPLDYAVLMSALNPLLLLYATQNTETSFKFILLCGNSTNGDIVQEVTFQLGLLPGSLLHRGMNNDINSLIAMSDIVVYAGSLDEQGFPLPIVRAMTFGLPIIAPNIPTFAEHITDGIHGLLFSKDIPDALMRCFSLLVSDGKLSELAKNIASSGRLLAENVLPLEHVISYAKLVETVLSFSSSSLLPSPPVRLKESDIWTSLWKEVELETDGLLHMTDMPVRRSIVYEMEGELAGENSTTRFEIDTESSVQEIPSEEDCNVLRELEILEEKQKLEIEEIKQRTDKNPGVWEDLYRNSRKADKLNFEANERDEGELERTGQPVCIYEIYDGTGAWPFLHHGSIYRGLSLSAEARRSRSDDVNAVSRLPILNITEYQHKLCEIGGMFSIANKVDNIHSRPWIGFQSWRAAGRKVSLSSAAENALDDKLQKETIGDVMYFWVQLDIDGVPRSTKNMTFWSMCDILNGGKCRSLFEDAFRSMYALPSYLPALPPMPYDRGYWSALHSWVMPTPSFLEFTMFARMFIDSLDGQSSKCLLSSSEREEIHCYCRIMEVLVNVWAYHSGRRMVYINPYTGHAEEQHPLESRKGILWAKYFNLSLLKSMDEDLAEAADDGDHPRDRWLWPLTGEIHWQGIYEREREERYRLKMNKKRRIKDKLNERMKSGYKQKPLGG